jgi:hypothetical protein
MHSKSSLGEEKFSRIYKEDLEVISENIRQDNKRGYT